MPSLLGTTRQADFKSAFNWRQLTIVVTIVLITPLVQWAQHGKLTSNQHVIDVKYVNLLSIPHPFEVANQPGLGNLICPVISTILVSHLVISLVI